MNSKQDEVEPFDLSVPDVARHFGTNVVTMRRILAAEEVPNFRLGRQRKYRRSDIEKLRESHTTGN